MKRFAISAAMGLFVFAASVSTASAQNYLADAWTFVGVAGDCGTGYPAGKKIVTSTWLNGMGLADNGATYANATKKDLFSGFLLSKHGPSSDCSSAGFQILGWTAGATLNNLGFDWRKGGHCGAGAPRFHIVDMLDNAYVLGCAHGQKAPAPQDPANWERVSFDAAGGPYAGDGGFQFGITQVKEIHVVYDEGTDVGVGLIVLDNIRINNTFITKKKGNPILP